MKKLITLVVVAAILILAAVKNPGEKEARELIKTEVVEQLNTKATDKAAECDYTGIAKQITGMVVNMFAPTLVDKCLDIEVENCVIFTKFNVTTTIKADKTSIASGVIVFGKIIPLKINLKG